MGTEFTGKTILVAGGTGALGRAVTAAFVGEGANVLATYRKQNEFDALTQSPRLEGVQLDVTDERAVADAIHRIVQKHGQIHGLVNAVGGYTGGVKLWETESSVLDQMLALNLRSGYVLCRAIVPVMLKQGHGSIVNVAAKAAVDHPAGAAAYVASKAAAVAMLNSLAADLRGTGVRVNSILPSIIDSEANRKAMPAADHTKWAKPEDIAKVILFLSSADAKLIHGASIPF
jgi:NAD(P)-dependent dehydrogenase (short-subunit alcohol dehydrogenase family)